MELLREFFLEFLHRCSRDVFGDYNRDSFRNYSKDLSGNFARAYKHLIYSRKSFNNSCKVWSYNFSGSSRKSSRDSCRNFTCSFTNCFFSDFFRDSSTEIPPKISEMNLPRASGRFLHLGLSVKPGFTLWVNLAYRLSLSEEICVEIIPKIPSGILDCRLLQEFLL